MSTTAAAATGVGAQLLERERELAVIGEVVEDASRGRGAVVLVEGVAGIGKSTLLAAAGEHARTAGLTVLAARGQDAEREFAFGGCLQLFERVMAEPARRERLLVGAAELARPLLGAPELGELADGPPAGADRIFGLLHGLFWLTANLADEGPVILAVDDAQWLDEPSLRFLRYLAVRIDELPVALLVAWRSGEPAHAQEHLSVLASEPSSPRLPLAPLSAAGVAAIVRADVAEAEPRFCEICSELTGGNPLYVTELVGAIKDAGIGGHAGESARVARLRPRAVATSVLARLTRRGEAAVELARAVAIAGDGTGLGRASALASLDRAAGAAAADALTEAGVLARERAAQLRAPAGTRGGLRRHRTRRASAAPRRRCATAARGGRRSGARGCTAAARLWTRRAMGHRRAAARRRPRSRPRRAGDRRPLSAARARGAAAAVTARGAARRVRLRGKGDRRAGRARRCWSGRWS